MMKRRNVESTKNRKQFHFRKCKFAEGMVGSNTFLYLKFLFMWILIMAADYLLEFRFEFLWPFWLLIRSLHDSLKYQGILFSFFFALVAFLSDLLFYMFLPVQWLFFAASTYVWVQYVWHTEKGICLPTVTLWLLFVYTEASLRLKAVKTVDLCRPFAAHCIGYPMVTLGFGFKSYLSYKLRLKKQKEIQKQNEFHMQLIAKALPVELQIKDKEKFKSINFEEQISSQQAVSSSSTPTSILRTLYNFAISIAPLNSNNSNSTTSQNTPIPAFNTSNASNNASSSSSATKDKQSTKKETYSSTSNSGGNSGSGLIASALSYYLNNNNNHVNNNTNTSNNNNNNNSNNNNSEEAPYIQQKDNFNRKNSNAEYINPKQDFFNAKRGSHTAQTNSTTGMNQENSVNFNVSSISIQSLAHQASTQSTTNANGNTNNLPNGNYNPLNGNLVLLSNPKIEENLDNDTDARHRSSSTSSNNSAFKSNNQHTNININMTINTTAIAAATANSPKTTSSTGTGTSTKSRSKNKDSNSLQPVQDKQPRANSVASSTSSSSSLSSSSTSSTSSGSTVNNPSATGGNKTSSKALKSDSVQFSFKDDLISRLEADIKKLREENEQQKTVEQYLRNQITYVTKCDRADKLKFEKLEKENKSLQNKLAKTTNQSQKDKDELEICEKRLENEKRAKDKLESQLAAEKKHREGQELQVAELKKKLSDALSKSKASSLAASQQQECTTQSDFKCGKRLKELEAENVKMGAELRKKQDRVLMLECELKSMSRTRDTESRVDTLMAALNLMEDKNASLQESLSAETRFKLDLFSALGEARRQLESCNFQLKSKERELNAFKALFKQTLSASGNASLSNSNILSSYLNGTTNSSESASSTATSTQNSQQQSADSTSKEEASQQNNISTLSSTSNSLNEWSSATNSLSAFLPKI